jgi:hypothetical protein
VSTARIGRLGYGFSLWSLVIELKFLKIMLRKVIGVWYGFAVGVRCSVHSVVMMA